MSPTPSAAKIAANQANARHSTGPCTEAGQAISARNAIKFALFAAKDFIRPGEQDMYDELQNLLRGDLAPAGLLEHHHVDEISRAMWRLRRCGEVEAAMVLTCMVVSCTDPNNPENPVPDAMQNEAMAKLQLSVDRARRQCHTLINRSTAELRKLQTERHVRNETMKAGSDISDLGLCDYRAIKKAGEETSRNEGKQFRREMERAFGAQPAPEPVAKQTHPSRNSRCTCGSGQRYKRCCGRNTTVLPKAA